MTAGRPTRARRTCHVVPGSDERFLEKARTLDADEVILDLEDAVAPSEKDRARAAVVAVLRARDHAAPTVAVRVNPTDTAHCYRDVIAVVEGAGEQVDTLVLPKVRGTGDIAMLDRLLTQIELATGLEAGRIGIEAQIEDPQGLIASEAVAACSPRMEALVFGPGDYSAAAGIPVTTIGGAPAGYPGDHLNHVLSRILVAARAAGIQAIDGPYGALRDDDGLRERSRVTRALGLDGKWTIHPSQIAIVNDVFSPTAAEFERATAILAAYRSASAGDGRGAALFGGEMIDEATRRMAERIARAGRAADMDE